LSVYADTSFLFSLYVLDANSARASLTARQTPPPLLITSLHELEFTNALNLRVFRKEVNRSTARVARGLFLREKEAGLFELKPLSPSVFREAERISLRRTPRLGARTLDILHVASALSLGAETFYTFDERQARLARAEGLKIR
jgi:predicted nucleic acid-binding protein